MGCVGLGEVKWTHVHLCYRGPKTHVGGSGSPPTGRGTYWELSTADKSVLFAGRRTDAVARYQFVVATSF